MSLEFFYDETFSTVSDLDPVDTFIGTGSQTQFTLVYKDSTDLASTITAENLQYYQFNGGFVKGATTFTLSSAPPLNAQIVAPGVIALVFSASDQPDDEDSNVSEVEFYLGDPTQIHLFNYVNLPQYNGIRISIVDLISGSGASISWIQLACSSPVDGTALTYAATGEAILTDGFSNVGLLTAVASAGASSMTVSNASNFIVGDYVSINTGQSTAEIRKVKEKTSTNIGFFTNLTYAHFVGEPVYDMGRKFWAKCTIPEDSANNQAFNFWNLGLRRQARNNSKV